MGKRPWREIPRDLAEEVGLGVGTEVSLTAKVGELVLLRKWLRPLEA